VSNKGVIYATYQRQFYVKLMSPSPPAYVGLVSAGWEVEGWHRRPSASRRPFTALRVS
jgi:hypothetical protein